MGLGGTGGGDWRRGAGVGRYGEGSRSMNVELSCDGSSGKKSNAEMASCNGETMANLLELIYYFSFISTF